MGQNIVLTHGQNSKRDTGLSTLHISTDKTVTSYVPSHLLAYCGATKLTVKRNFETYKTDYEHIRGNIQGFSKSSRRRLMDKLSRINKTELPVFVTLTFADEHKESGAITRHKGLLKAFRMRLDRKFGSLGAIWRFETVTRKSGLYLGALFPHYHLLVWGITDLVAFRTWVAINWYEVCGSLTPKHLQAGTAVEQIRDVRGTFRYASKYLGKINEEYSKNWHNGRVWGEWNSENIPYVKAILCQLSEAEAVQLIRYMKRYAKINGRDYKALSIFCDVDFWYNNLTKILYGNEPKIINKSIDKVHNL